MRTWKNPVTGREIAPLYLWHPNIRVRSTLTVVILFSQIHPPLAILLNLGNFGYLYQFLYTFYVISYCQKKVARINKIWCNVIELMLILQRPLLFEKRRTLISLLNKYWEWHQQWQMQPFQLFQGKAHNHVEDCQPFL